MLLCKVLAKPCAGGVVLSVAVLAKLCMEMFVCVERYGLAKKGTAKAMAMHGFSAVADNFL